VPAIIFPNVTSSTQFATLGYEGKFFGTVAGSLNGSGFSVSYDAAANHYVMQVPVSLPGVLESADFPGTIFSAKLTDPSNPSQFQPINFGVGRSTFDYTAWAYSTSNSEIRPSAAGWPLECRRLNPRSP
jgi:hypothetical protein